MGERKSVIVIGGGFAGLQLCRNLSKKYFDVLLIDRLNHHQFQPLFYQVATSQIEPSSISFPLRKIFQNRKNISIRMAEVESIDASSSRVKTSAGVFPYDTLVIATGCTTNFFGNAELQKHALTLKSTYEAITIRNRILTNFETLLSDSDPNKEAYYNIVIVGGGPTGVELAGSFAEIKKNVLPKDYPGIDHSKLKVILLEGSKHTLNSMSDVAKSASRKYLEKMGVIVRTEVYVKNYDGDTATLSTGETIRTKNLIWAAGITGNIISGLKDAVITPSRRMMVDRYNKVKGCENIYAVGDIAYMETPAYPKGHPQLANVAINQAKNLAKNLNRIISGEKLKEYEYRDLGSMATIGTNKAVVDLSWWKFKGFFAWLVWMFLHLMLILSVRNKLIIFINWAWSYLTKDSSLRLILKDNREPGSRT